MSYGSSIYNCNRVTSSSQLSGSDLLGLFLQQNGGDSTCSLTLFADWLSDNITVEGDSKVTQYSAPSATGFTVTVGSSIAAGSSIWLILTPVAGYAAGTLTLPAVADVVDKQEILCNCTQSVTTLTISGNGATVTGAPTTLAANAFFTLRFDRVLSTWYRVN